ncbi:MAG: tRNA-dihydrouridine synthase family protein [Pseudomonadota bacterium]|nr:tRNA-dihydrouridine synthase family protein [Pseudomonadota bacterium]
MVGLSHVSFRRLLREYLPAGARTIWPTEMLNSRRLPDEDLTRLAESRRDSEETNLVPQILGNEETYISRSVRKLEGWGATAIDINMGCPVKKALKHNFGVSLMGDAAYAAEVVAMTVRSTHLPVSVKLRAGFTGEPEFLKGFVKNLESAGASWISFHPRRAEQQRRGRADWRQIKLVREHLSIPVIGNGDVQIADDVFAMLKQTGCDMVMVGRALTAKPWLLWQIGEKLGFAPPIGRRGLAPKGGLEEANEYGKILLRMADYLLNDYGPELGYKKFRFFVLNGSCWLDFGQQLYSLVAKAKTFVEVKPRLVDYFSQELRMREKTELRF